MQRWRFIFHHRTWKTTRQLVFVNFVCSFVHTVMKPCRQWWAIMNEYGPQTRFKETLRKQPNKQSQWEHFNQDINTGNVFTSCYLGLLLSQVGKTLIQDNGNKWYANHYFSPGMGLARLHPSISDHVFREWFCAEAENNKGKRSPARNIRVSQNSTLEHGLLTATDWSEDSPAPSLRCLSQFLNFIVSYNCCNCNREEYHHPTTAAFWGSPLFRVSSEHLEVETTLNATWFESVLWICQLE